jgi:membrane protease YdiL (CAAX protease family)
LPPWTSGLALALLLPVPSLGTWVGLVLLPGQQTGRAIFFLAKVWLVALPILWRLAIERRALSWSPPRHGGFVPGLLLGLGMSAAILVAYAGLGPSLLDPEAFRRMGAVSGLNRWPIYLAGSLYWVSVNSVLEEMVWRWFVVERCEAVGWGRWSVLASAVGFTAHHVVALRVYCAWPATLVCAFGIFVGGAIWSALYRRTRSVWPGYLSHAIVDVAIFVLGWQLISGG